MPSYTEKDIRILVAAVRMARLEFQRISYQIKADPDVTTLLDKVQDKYKEVPTP